MTEQKVSEYKRNDLDETVVMTKKPSIEEAFFPAHVAERYLVKRFLGKGAFGMVYLAEDRKIGRLVAIKQLFASLVQDSEIHDRFIQEARIGAQLDHTNIINVFALEENERSACIIMEFLSGGSLESRVEESGGLPPAVALDIFRGLMTGLRAAHDVMVIHRDIKPANILFDHFANPKISDFGIVSLPVVAGDRFNAEAEMDSMIGTPRYMSPEQISGVELDFRTDLYSAGVVLHEMLTGEKFFREMDDMDDEEIPDVILHRKPEAPGGDIPQRILEMTMRLIEKDRNARYPTADAVLSEIDGILEGLNGTPAAAGAKFAGRHSSLNSNAAELEEVIRLFLVDGVIAPAERVELNRRAEKLGFSPAQAKAMEEKIRTETCPSLR